MLCRLIYASRAVRPLSDVQLVDLLKVARANNEACGLTGLLLYANLSFLQVLEGEKARVDEIYDKIERDHRHQSIRLLMRTGVDSRKFDTWSMGFEHIDDQGLADALPGFQAATEYPLVNADLVKNGIVAETLLSLYRRNSRGA